MDFLDTPTLLRISALFNLLAALAWLVLAELFRIAPRASRLMAGAHAARLLAEGCVGLVNGWPLPARQAVTEFGQFASMLLLLLALRRMLRSRNRMGDLRWLGSAGVLAIALCVTSGSVLAPQLASTAAVTLLALLAMSEVVRGVGRQLSTAMTLGMALPFAALALLGLGHGVSLMTAPTAEALHGGLSATTVVLYLLLTAGITLSLIALTIWRLIARIQHLTERDPLTGALNRRAFEQALAEAQAQLRRGHGFALAMLDVDHFKRVNDAHGHPAGDAALRHCVQVWQAGLREVDQLGRVGGEEFCALLPLADAGDLATATQVAERLRAGLAAQPLHWEGQLLRLTASIGVALPVAGDTQAEVVLARADAELYRAKAEGRNRVCVATHLGGVAV